MLRDYIYYEPAHSTRQQNKYGNPQPQSYKPLQGFQESHAELIQQQHTHRWKEQVHRQPEGQPHESSQTD